MSTTELETYVYGDGVTRLRVVHLPGDDQPWFVARDACDALELVNTTNALKILDDDEKKQVSGTFLGVKGGPSRPVVNEAGLYALIFQSRKLEAKKYKRWVTHEVLPSIRKTGAYIAPSAMERWTDEHVSSAKGVAFAINTLREHDTRHRVELELNGLSLMSYKQQLVHFEPDEVVPRGHVATRFRSGQASPYVPA